MRKRFLLSFFFFQAEDGIRDVAVTGVQTCALPIWARRRARVPDRLREDRLDRVRARGRLGARGGQPRHATSVREAARIHASPPEGRAVRGGAAPPRGAGAPASTPPGEPPRGAGGSPGRG